VRPPAGEVAAEVLHRLERLGALAVADGEGAVLDAGVDVDADPGLGDDGGTAHADGQELGEAVAGAVPDEHVVGPVAERDGDR
jgi:hypothetical protein